MINGLLKVVIILMWLVVSATIATLGYMLLDFTVFPPIGTVATLGLLTFCWLGYSAITLMGLDV